MATQTPNLGLTLPVGTENVSRTVINGNNTLIDTFAGNVNTAMDQMGSNLGILETGDTATHAIAKGEYVTWNGASYTADAAISIGETLAATGGSKNLTACDKGIANALNSKITSYSTTEEEVGKWIDGSPIYKISGSITNQQIAGNTNYTLYTFSTDIIPLKIEGTAYFTGGTTIEFLSNDKQFLCRYRRNNKTLEFNTGGYSATSWNILWTVYYIKN